MYWKYSTVLVLKSEQSQTVQFISQKLNSCAMHVPYMNLFFPIISVVTFKFSPTRQLFPFTWLLSSGEGES